MGEGEEEEGEWEWEWDEGGEEEGVLARVAPVAVGGGGDMRGEGNEEKIRDGTVTVK